MAAASSRSTRSGAPVLRSSNGFHRSVSPSGRYCSAAHHHHHHHYDGHIHAPPSSYAYYYSPSPTYSASGFASSTSSFSTRSSPFFHPHAHHHHRDASPTRVNLVGSAPLPPSVRFAIDPRSISPGRSLTAAPGRHHHPHPHPHHHQIANKHSAAAHPQQRRTCMCSPTTHPGSFRCALHKNAAGFHHPHAVSGPSNRLNARRSAMTNSLVRIGTVEGDLVRRALAALIRPSSHQQRRRASFQPRPSRLSVMSKAGDDYTCRS